MERNKGVCYDLFKLIYINVNNNNSIIYNKHTQPTHPLTRSSSGEIGVFFVFKGGDTKMRIAVLVGPEVFLYEESELTQEQIKFLGNYNFEEMYEKAIVDVKEEVIEVLKQARPYLTRCQISEIKYPLQQELWGKRLVTLKEEIKQLAIDITKGGDTDE